MPWCPICNNEYKEGITICQDCGCDLVEKETDIRKKITFGEADEMEELSEFLRINGIEQVETFFDEEENVTEISVVEKDSQKAEKMISIFWEQKEKIQKRDEEENEVEEIEEITEEDQTLVKTSSLYENSASKADDNKSSAYTLLLVGIAGIIVIILGMTDVLPIHLYGTSKYMTYGIMGTLFVLFIVMGMVSMKSYHIFSRKAESENSLQDTMEKWCLDTLKQEKIDSELFVTEENVTEEEKYFKRVKFMKEKLSQKFFNLDEAFLDHFVDEIYA
ncbi:MAG TPA: hypothetical protein VJY54_03545, partial [Lachnospiraceae bacterium]|nr:hypothetical protein [Lachnospiraceae bacterium]